MVSLGFVGPLEALLWHLGVLWVRLGSLGVSGKLLGNPVCSLWALLGALEGLVVALGSLGKAWGALGARLWSL